MRLCDAVVVVVRLDVPGLRQARRLTGLIADQRVPQGRIRLVANRYGQAGQLAWKKAEEAVGTPFLEYLPDDSGKLNQALTEGRPVVRLSPSARFSRSLAKLADLLNGRH
jgi:Flp pilus assembly CpaE family ATPase